MITKKRIGLILGPLSFLLIQLFIEPEGLSSEGKQRFGDNFMDCNMVD
jgi:hypothetical protein